MNAARLLIAFTLCCGGPNGAEPPDDARHRGASWVAGREITPLDIQPLVQANVNWIVQTPFGWQRGIDSPQIKLITGPGVFWGDKPWFAGVYWWKWYPTHGRAGGPGHGGFTPQNKPAQQVMTDWYGRPPRPAG